MPDHPLRKILSGIVRSSSRENVTITYLHRGAPDDRTTINVSSIQNVRKGSFVLSDGETQIPFHRILEVKDNKTGTVIWIKKSRPNEQNRNP